MYVQYVYQFFGLIPYLSINSFRWTDFPCFDCAPVQSCIRRNGMRVVLNNESQGYIARLYFIGGGGRVNDIKSHLCVACKSWFFNLSRLNVHFSTPSPPKIPFLVMITKIYHSKKNLTRNNFRFFCYCPKLSSKYQSIEPSQFAKQQKWGDIR